MPKFSKYFLSLVLIIGLSTFVMADPIRIITGSNVVFGGSPNASDYNFSGEGLNADGTLGNGTFTNSICISQCNVIGTAVNLTFQSNTLDINAYPLGYNGRVTYQGNTYVVIQSSFTFITETGIVQPVPPGLNYRTATMNFTMTGNLTLRSLSTTVPDTVISVFGNGTASIDYVQNPNNPNSPMSIGFIRYRYGSDSMPTGSPTPDPTPEPATFLLLGAGLAGIFGYAKHKKRQKPAYR